MFSLFLYFNLNIMAIPSEESVSVKRASKPGEPTEISINCPDKVGLGCDVARIIYEFGLSVVRGADLFTDGKWCFLVFWVVARIPGARGIKWSLLKHRLTAVCPSNDPILLPAIKPAPKKREVYLVQVCSSDRFGLLNDVTQVLWEAEVTIQRVNASTSPDGRAVDLFFITDNRITTEGGVCFLNIFIQDAKGRKLYDERKQRELVRRLRTELEEPIGVGVATTGPDSELLVSTPVERCGRGRPRVLYDVTYVLAQLGLQIFKGDITRHQLDGRQYEVYRFLLLDREGQPVADEHVQADIAAQVRNILMG
eukprot:jgi/Mesen1/1998/ME000147S01104